MGVGQEFACGRHRDALIGIDEGVITVCLPEEYGGCARVFFTDETPEMLDLRIFFAQDQQPIILFAPLPDLIVDTAFGGLAQGG